MVLTDDSFLTQFENQTLSPEQFNHRGHLRLAWLNLNRCSLEKAIEKVTQGISDYAMSLGATDKFHHTLTEAIVRIMDNRMSQQKYSCFGAFLESNSDLVEDMEAVIGKHYSDDVLTSIEARRSFVAPDLVPFQEHK